MILPMRGMPAKSHKNNIKAVCGI